jgi:hypothetical protein
LNLLPLLAALLPWASTPSAAITRVFLAISLLSIEMQAVTLAGAGSLGALMWPNLALAVGLAAWQARQGRPSLGRTPAWRAAAPGAGWLALGAGGLALNGRLPLEEADPYRLVRGAQSERCGTVA